MEFVGDIARKTGDAALLGVEAEKSRRAAAIGRSSGLFRVPTVLSLDGIAQTLEFAREPNLVTFIQFVGSCPLQSVEIADRIGRALARIHTELRLDESMQVPLPSEWLTPHEEPVFLHGDLTANNICVDTLTKELVIVDWSAAPMVGRMATMGPRCFDILCLIRHIMIGARSKDAFNWPGGTICDRLVTSYVEEFGSTFPRDTWFRHTELLDAISDRVVSERISNAPLYARPGKSLIQRMLLWKWRRYVPPKGTLTP